MITKYIKKIVQYMCTGASHGSPYSTAEYMHLMAKRKGLFTIHIDTVPSRYKIQVTGHCFHNTESIQNICKC